MNNLTEEESILQAAKAKYDAQESWNQRHIPLDLFIEKERARRQPGYKEPLSVDEVIKMIRVTQNSDQKNILTSSIARLDLFANGRKNHIK